MIYNHTLRTLVKVLQGFLAGLLVMCLLTIRVWTGENGSGELGMSFERTDVFLRTVEEIVRRKIDYLQNKELFERGGSYDDTRAVDIRLYSSGTMDEANLNVNTSYYLSDLLVFAKSGAAGMERRIRALLDQGYSDEQAGERLEGDAQSLEIVLPISGGTLADYSHLSANPGIALLTYYRDLYETAQDVERRYMQYQEDLEQEQSENAPQAPSNVLYYVENTSTKQRYTNVSAKSMSGARAAVQALEGYELLFEGDRRFNIMVASPENILNEEASRFFLGQRFVGSSERVLLAVNLDFPIGDRLQEAYRYRNEIRPYAFAAMAVAVTCAMILPFLLALSIVLTGKNQKGRFRRLDPFDRVQTEIAGGIVFLAGSSWWIAGQVLASRTSSVRLRLLIISVFAGTEYIIWLLGLLSLVRRIRVKTLWSNSVIHALLQGLQAVYDARRLTRSMLLVYLGYFALNIIFLRFLGLPGLILSVVMTLVAILYLMRDMVGNQNVREGLRQISKGKLDYRIRTDILTGESREMGEAVNEMGDGLQAAVESMLRNERLKAELITNVSHDLKTPLTSIINYIDLLKKENLEDPRAVGYVQILDQKAQRLRQLTEDLIEVSKISSGNVELHMETLQLGQFAWQAVGEFEEHLEERSLHISVQIPRGSIKILADGKQLWRVFENLLGNIAKYAKPETTVKLQIETIGQQARVVFENISLMPVTAPPEELMERFVRGDSSRGSEPGSGLGLSIASSLTKLMGGSFSLEVEGELFRAILLFPLQEDSAGSAE